MSRIHPTAIVDGSAKLGDGAIIGPYCVVEGDVEIGAGTELRSHAVVRRYTTLGAGNLVDSFAVLGGLPQDLHFEPDTPTYVRIGDRNIFREGVTISRATAPGGATTVGSDTYWMACAHIGHDATVEDRAILVNNVAVAGHATIHRRAILSGGSLVHQFTWVGELVITQGLSAATMHVPPYTMVAAGINKVAGLNRVGLRRATDIDDEDRRQIKEAFRLTYRAHLTPAKAIEKLDEWGDITPAAATFREFVRKVTTAEKPYDRGLCPFRQSRWGS